MTDFLTDTTASEDSLENRTDSLKVSSGDFYERPAKPKRLFNCCRVVSFSFDDSSIEMAVVQNRFKKTRIIDIRKIYLPEGHAPVNNNDSFIKNTLADYLKEFWRKGTRINLVTSNRETVFRIIMMPKLPAKELRAALRFELKKLVPFPVDECYFDYRILSEVKKDGKVLLKLGIQAATRRLINNIIRPLNELGYNVKGIYNSYDVIGQLLTRLPHFKKDCNYALLNIEKDTSQIAYYRGGNLEFHHQISIGSRMLSNREDDEKFDHFTEILANEIQNSLDFYTGQFSSHFTNRIYIHGDLSYAEEVIKLLSSHFGFDFTRFPAEKLDLESSEDNLFEYTLPVSLSSLAACLNNVKLANLLPPEKLIQQRRHLVDQLSLAGISVLILVLAYNWYSSKTNLAAEQERLDQYNRDLQTYQQSDEYQTYRRLKAQIAYNQAVLEKIKTTPSYMNLNLKELSRIIPAGVKLQNFQYSTKAGERNLLISGIVTDIDIPPELVLAEFVENLNRSPFYDMVRVDKHIKKLVKGKFQLDFYLSLRGIV